MHATNNGVINDIDGTLGTVTIYCETNWYSCYYLSISAMLIKHINIHCKLLLSVKIVAPISNQQDGLYLNIRKSVNWISVWSLFGMKYINKS